MAFKGLMGKMRKGLAVAALGLAALVPTKEANAQSVFFDIVQRDGLTTLAPNTTYTFDVVAKTEGLTDNGISFLDFKVNVNDNLNDGFNISNVAPTSSSSYLNNDFFNGVNMLNGSASYNAVNDTIHFFREVSNPNSSPSHATYYTVASFDFNTGSSYTGSFNLGFDNSSFAVFDKDGADLSFAVDSYSGSVGAVPEPSTYAALAGLAVLGAAAAAKRRKNAKASSSPVIVRN